MKDHFNVLFLCTGNSARSIMAEAILNNKGGSQFTAYSAGSHPTGRVCPAALREIASAGITINGLRSKSWDEFATPGAPVMDFVFTVCDNVADEQCPKWPGRPTTAHWGIPNPAAVFDRPEKIEWAFRNAFSTLERRIGLFTAMPLSLLDWMAINWTVKKIGLL